MTPDLSRVTQPVLSFAVPTWNRAAKLRECILRIAAQILMCNINAEICVSNNGSDDDTGNVLNDLSAAFPFLRSVRQSSNIGFDRNLFAAIEQCAGEYVWIFSDDDFLADNALATVLMIIAEHHPSYIATNYYTADENAKPLAVQGFRSHMASKDIDGARLEEIFSSPMTVGFMSRSIFRRSLLLLKEYRSELPNIEPWSQLYAIAQVTVGRHDAYISSFYAVGCRVVAARYDSDALIKKLPEVLDYIFRKFQISDATRRYCMHKIRDHFITWRSFIKYRAIGPEISPLIYPRGYKFIPQIPKSWVKIMLRLKKSVS